MVTAAVDEIFSSVQGEGPWLGERHIFVRFIGCDIRCEYCDTPSAAERSDRAGKCRAQKEPSSFERELVPENITPEELTGYCSRLVLPGPSRPVLSLTGGEPLLQHGFLSTWLHQVHGRFSMYLETNGIHAESMAGLASLIDVVSMDFKLPSATGLGPFWDEHRKFLDAARGTKLFGKAVVTAGTVLEDVMTAAGIIAQHDDSLTLVIQPAAGRFAPDAELLIAFQNAALGVLRDVRIIPQVHHLLNVP